MVAVENRPIPEHADKYQINGKRSSHALNFFKKKAKIERTHNPQLTTSP